MNTFKTTLQDCQTLMEVKSDGLPGPITNAAWKALCAGAVSIPDAPFPAPAVSPPAPTAAVSAGSPIYGIDSVEPLSLTWISRAIELLGTTPRFCGRYFGPGRPATYQYQPSVENPLSARKVPILLIAEQTRDVAGSSGAADGAGNAQNIVTAFGADFLASIGRQFYVFLDVEGSPSLSSEYWEAWSAALIVTSMALSGNRFSFLPAVYASQGDGATWAALKAAMASGAPCDAAWVASYARVKATPRPFAPSWDPNRARMNMPDGSEPPNVPIVLWQFLGIETDQPSADDKLFEALDCNLLSPSVKSSDFLSKCILPA